ncbi:hypothetical protein ABCR94_08175, partial [Streptomyces sp. 21So2-11]
SMKDWSHTPDAPTTIRWEQHSSGDSLLVYVPSLLGTHAKAKEARSEALARATEYRGPDDSYAFPSLGSMKKPAHPLPIWWATLFGLSILARYEPADWAAIINIDGSKSANSVEHLLDQAIEVIPHLALIAIRNVAGS